VRRGTGLLVAALHGPLGITDRADPFQRDVVAFDGLLQLNGVGGATPDTPGRNREVNLAVCHLIGWIVDGAELGEKGYLIGWLWTTLIERSKMNAFFDPGRSALGVRQRASREAARRRGPVPVRHAMILAPGRVIDSVRRAAAHRSERPGAGRYAGPDPVGMPKLGFS
jgi:hypothetical protein